VEKYFKQKGLGIWLKLCSTCLAVQGSELKAQYYNNWKKGRKGEKRGEGKKE
jgi:hypothetical protein